MIGSLSMSVAQFQSNSEDAWTGWTCDELTPDLCEDLEVSTGIVSMQDGLIVKYWKYATTSSSSLSEMPAKSSLPLYPIIVIHGGPGVPHNYMLPLKQQACRGREIYFYDQTGCGESKIPAGNQTSDYPYLLDPLYYSVVELPALIEFWGLHKYHVIAHSWGTILSQYFELTTRPPGLVSLTLSGPLSDGDLYAQSQWDKFGDLGSLPPFVQERIDYLEKTLNYDSKEYKAIVEVLTGFFSLRTSPAPDCVKKAQADMNDYIYVGMQGPSEFSFGGTLVHFNTTPRLPTIHIPVLLTSGAFDTVRPPVVDAMYQTIPKVEWVVFNHSGHVSMVDDAGWMNNVVEDFLNRAEKASSGGLAFAPKMSACGTSGCISKYIENQELTATEASSNSSLWMIISAFLAGSCIGWIGSMVSRNNCQKHSDYETL